MGKKARLYKIPQNGILRTQFDSNYGWIANDSISTIFYVDSRENKKKKILVSNTLAYQDEMWRTKYKDSIVAFLSPVIGASEFNIYPIFIDTLKNHNKMCKENTQACLPNFPLEYLRKFQK